MHRRLPTKARLFNHGCNLDDVNCVLCSVTKETDDHLLLHCPFSTAVWEWFSSRLGLQLHFSNCGDFWLNKRKEVRNRDARWVWDALATAISWSIWNERNGRLFNKSFRSIDTVIHAANILLLSWTDSSTAKKRRKLDDALSMLREEPKEDGQSSPWQLYHMF